MPENINFFAFKTAWQHLPKGEYPFLQKQLAWAKANKPYQGLKIIHNIPLSLETLCKLEVLLHSGANITITPMQDITPKTQAKAIEILQTANINLLTQSEAIKNEYDYALDCCAELSNFSIKKGVVELTRSGAITYAATKKNIPILSVDDSKTKQLETFFGTGESFVRAFAELSQKSIATQNILLFGYGKVGQGIAYGVLKFCDNLTVCDNDEKKLAKARANNITAVNFKAAEQLKTAITKATLVVTATGITNFISDNFSSCLFKQKFLANMGALDEYGQQFSTNEVLNSKLPINFCLDSPTTMRYLDPSFYAHNLGIKILQDNNYSPNFYSLPQAVDMEILREWQQHFKEDISKIVGNLD